MRLRRLAFWALNRVSEWCLIRMAFLAKAMGDQHEIEHIAAMMEVGHSADCKADVCNARLARCFVVAADGGQTNG